MRAQLNVAPVPVNRADRPGWGHVVGQGGCARRVTKRFVATSQSDYSRFAVDKLPAGSPTEAKLTLSAAKPPLRAAQRTLSEVMSVCVPDSRYS